MKTFKQFLNEADNDLLAMIERDCGPFLKESQKAGFLYRGIQPGGKDLHTQDVDGNKLVYIVKNVRKDRNPRDTSDDMHDALNKWFNDKFGFKARTEAVFAYGGDMFPTTIKEYGDTHIIFPIGEIKYVWSPEVEDLYVHLEAYEIENPEDAESNLKQLRYQSTDLHEALKYGNEIMVKCDKYYAFPAEYKQELKKSLGF